jgi:hypothetical protein
MRTYNVVFTRFQPGTSLLGLEDYNNDICFKNFNSIYYVFRVRIFRERSSWVLCRKIKEVDVRIIEKLWGELN